MSTFLVPGCGWETTRNTASLQEARRRRCRLGVGGAWVERPGYNAGGYYDQVAPCKVVLRFSESPPETIADPSLLEKNSLSASGPCEKGSDPRLARVDCNAHHAVWVPPRAPDMSAHFLQVDLHEDCEVTYLSTKGRFPPLVGRPFGSLCMFTGALIMADRSTGLEAACTLNQSLLRSTVPETQPSSGN